VAVSDQLDAETKAALAKADPTYDGQKASVPVKTFLNLYLSVPVTGLSIARGNRFDRILTQSQAPQDEKASKDKPTRVQPPKRKKQDFRKQDQPIEKDRPKGAKPKATEPPSEAPRHEVIIITPLDTQTRHTLRRLVRRIEHKRKNQVSDQSTPYPSIYYESRMIPALP
jgi:hypothetical protein